MASLPFSPAILTYNCYQSIDPISTGNDLSEPAAGAVVIPNYVPSGINTAMFLVPLMQLASVHLSTYMGEPHLPCKYLSFQHFNYSHSYSHLPQSVAILWRSTIIIFDSTWSYLRTVDFFLFPFFVPHPAIGKVPELNRAIWITIIVAVGATSQVRFTHQTLVEIIHKIHLETDLIFTIWLSAYIYHST